MLNTNDKALLEALQDRLSVKVSVRSNYTTSEELYNTLCIALMFTDDEGEKHEIASDETDLPASRG